MAAKRIRRPRQIRFKAISLAVASCFSVTAETALANPTGAVVASGTATFSQQGNSLAITNSPGAIINWRAFSIGTNEITRFIQQSSASSVLNRVVGVDPSVILGALQSNGRVFLINPNGILFGAGAQIDVAGLVASTLNLSNADFAAGKLRFTDTPGAGTVNNQGAVTTPSGGQVYLIAPNVQNSGIITSPKGEVILAAGHTVELVDAGTPNLRIEITAPDTQAVNIGQIVASSGKIGIYAGLIKNSGEIRADGVVIGQNGEILLKATNSVTLDKGSVVSASGPTAGKVTIQADSGTVTVAGTVAANATQGAGGTVNIAGAQGVGVASTARISADGTQGGSVSLASSAGNVTIAAPVTANATAGSAGQLAVNAAASLTLATGGQLSASGGLGGGAITAYGRTGVTFQTGSLVQASGAVGGTVSAQALQGGFIGQGTIDVSATDLDGGVVSIAAGSDITLDITSRILARGRAGGEVRVESTSGTLLASGLIDGQGSGGPGGLVYLLAPRVALLNRAVVDVSGETGGGIVLVGGDYQGRNPDIQNAYATFIGQDATIRADALTHGDGGRVIVWSDDATRMFGSISAKGGVEDGNGGFSEVSSKNFLVFNGRVSLDAPSGHVGTLLLDPSDVTIVSGSGVSDGSFDGGSSNNIFSGGTGSTTIGWSTIQGNLSGTANVIITTSGSGASNGGTITISNDSPDLNTANTFQLVAHNNINVNGSITNSGTGDIKMYAGWDGVSAAAPTVQLGVGSVNVTAPISTGGNFVARAGGDISISNSITALGDLTLGAGGNVNIVAQANPIIVSAGNDIKVSGVNFQVGSSGATQATMVTAGHDLIVGDPGDHSNPALTGAMTVRGGDTTLGSGPTRDASATVHANNNVTISAAGFNIVAGTASATGSLSATSANADAELSAGNNMTLTIGALGASIAAGHAQVNAEFGDVYDASANARLTAGGTLTMTVAGGGLMVAGGVASAVAQSGSATVATANANTLISAGAGKDISITVSSGDLTISGGHATAAAYHWGSASSSLSGANTAAASANATLSAGRHLNVTVTSGNLIVAGGNATASAYQKVIFGSADPLSGTNNATADANVKLETTGIGGNLTLTLGGAGSVMQVGGNHAVANAYHSASSARNGVLNGDNTATANANITFNAAGTLTVSGTPTSIVRIGSDAAPFFAQQPTAVAAAYQKTNWGSSNSLAGTNQSTANANLIFNAAGAGGLTVTAGELRVRGGQAFAQAFHLVDNGNTNTLAGDNTAIANSEVSFNATHASGDLTINVNSGPVTVTGPTTSLPSDATRAFKHVNGGDNHDLSGGNNNATGLAEVKFTAGHDIAVTAGSLTVNSGGGAAASADKTATGSFASFNRLGGINTTNATANIGFTAGNNLTINLGVGVGPLSVHGASANAYAYHTIDGGEGFVSNTLSGNNNATATANTGFTAGAALTINAGNVTINGGRGQARAFKQVTGSSFSSNFNNAVSGNNTANGASGITLSGASLALTLGTGSLHISGSSADARAYHMVNNNNNYSDNLSGSHIANAASNITLAATGGTLTVAATGGISIGGGGASASANKNVAGSGHTVSGDNTASANSNILLSGTAGITLSLGTGGVTISGGRALVSAYDNVGGSNNAVSGNHVANATANVTLAATGGTLLVTAASVSLGDGGEGGNANAHMDAGGNLNTIGGGAGVASNTATATDNISLSGPDVTLTLTGGLTVSGLRTTASAYHSVNGNGTNLNVDQSVTANGNIALTATGGSGTLTVTAPSGINISGGGAQASAYKTAYNSSHIIAGNNTAVANSNISLGGANVALNLGAGSLSISGSSARAYAYHYVNGQGNSFSAGDHSATANSVITLAATGGTLQIGATGGISIYGSSAVASAYKYTYNGNHNTLSGNNTAIANSNITLNGANGIQLNAGAGNVLIRGSSARALAYHDVVNGSGNTVSGNHSATANSNITLDAGAGLLAIDATGGVTINASNTRSLASAYKNVSGSADGSPNHSVFGNNTATANATIALNGTGITLALGATGNFNVTGGNASAGAYHSVSGSGNAVGGNHVANATGNISLDARGQPLMVTALNMSLADGGEGGGGAFANAHMFGSGYNNSIGPAFNNALADRSTSLSGGSIQLNLTGGLTISGARATATAVHSIGSGSANTLNGNQTATATSNISLTATSGPLTVNAAGGVNIYGNSASAQAYKRVSGSGHIVSGNNSATATSNITLSGASVALNLGTGSLYISGSSASARAYHSANGFGHTLSGDNMATASSNISLTATGALTIDAGGGASFYVGSAYGQAYKSVSGNSHTVSGNNTATANSSVNLGGTSVALNLATGGFTADGAEGGAQAYHHINGNGNNLSGVNTANGVSNIILSAANTLSIQAGNISVQAGSANARASNSFTGGVNTGGANIALGDGNVRIVAGLTSLSLDAGAGSVYLGARNAQANASNFTAPGAGNNTATAHANTLVATGGDMTITGGSLTVQASSATATTSGSGANIANANANAGILSLGTNTVVVTGSVNLIGGFVSGSGAASAFAMLDPAMMSALNVTANDVNLTTNTGGVILSASGSISITAPGGFFVDSVVPVPGGFAGFPGAPGVNFGQSSPIVSSVVSSDPLIISFGGSIKNLTNLFGLPAAFLPPPPGTVFWDDEAGDHLWLDALNWSGNSIPGFTQSVVIGSFAPITLTGAANIKSLVSDTNIILSGGGAVLTMSNPSTITTTLAINGGTVNANGGLTVNTLNLTAGALNGLGNLVIGNSYSQTGGTIGAGFDLIDITQAAGNLAINNPLSATSVYLTAPTGNITEGGAGAINTGNLAVASGGTVTLNGPNSALNVVADLTINGGTGAFSFTNAAPFNVAGAAAINGITGVTTNGGDITLTSTGAGHGIFVQPTFAGYAIDTGPSGSGILTINSSEWLVVNNFADLRGGQVVLSSGSNLGIAVGQINLVATGNAVNSVDFISNTGPIKSSADITAAGGVHMFTGAAGLNGNINLDNGNGGSTINAAGLVNIQSGGVINAYDETNLTSANSYVNITGSDVNLNAGNFIYLGGVPGQGNLTATTGNVVVTTASSFSGGGSTGSISAPLGNVTVTAGGFAEFDGPVTASPTTGTISVTASGIYAGGNMSAKAISLNSTDVTLSTVDDVIYLYNAATIIGGTVNMQAVGSIYLEDVTVNATQAGLPNGTPAITLASTVGNIYAPASMTTVSGGVSLNASGFVEMDAASNGGIIHATGDANITAGTAITASGMTPSTAWMEVWGSNVNLNAGTFVNLGAVTGHGLKATNGNVNVTAGTSMGGFSPGSMRGPIQAINGDVHIALLGTGGPGTSFLDLNDSISASSAGHNVLIDNNVGGPVNASISVGGPITAGSNITLKAANFIDIGNGGLTSIAGNVIVNTGDQLFSAGAISAAGGTINLTSATGMSVLVNSDGTNLTATNNASGNLVLTSSAPLFTVGANLTNNAPSGRYYITAVNDMTVNGPTGNSKSETFGAGNLLTVNGYANMSGLGVLMTGSDVTFSGGPTTISGALGVIAAGNLNVNNVTVQSAGAVSVTVGNNLNVDGAAGRLMSNGGSFSGYVTKDINVTNGGIIYGNPDVSGPPTGFDPTIKALAVGGKIFISDPGSRIEAGSAHSISIWFPLLTGSTTGGFSVNGSMTGQVWDASTLTGFYAGGQPAVLGGSLKIYYGFPGLPGDVILAINSTVAAVDQSVTSPVEKDKKDKDDKEAKNDNQKSLSTKLKLVCE